MAGAARRLRLSPSAMSRALARLRRGNRRSVAGEGWAGTGSLTPSHRASRPRLSARARRRSGAAPRRALDLARLERTFTLRTSEGFVENFGAKLLARVSAEAPGVRLRFLPKADQDSAPLRDGSVDLETGVVGKTTGPEVRAQALFRDRFVGVVRTGHRLSKGKVTPARYAAARHVQVSRGELPAWARSTTRWPHWGWSARLRRPSAGSRRARRWPAPPSLVASVPERHTGDLRDGMHSFALPLPIPRSRSHCSGIREWMAIPRIAGFEGAFEMPAPRNSQPFTKISHEPHRTLRTEAIRTRIL